MSKLFPTIEMQPGREALKAQNPHSGKRWCLAVVNIQRDPYEATVEIIVLAEPGEVNVSDSRYEDAERLLAETLKPRHEREADTNTEPIRYLYDTKGNRLADASS